MHVASDDWEIAYIVQKLEVKSDIIVRAFFDNSQGSLQLATINLLYQSVSSRAALEEAKPQLENMIVVILKKYMMTLKLSKQYFLPSSFVFQRATSLKKTLYLRREWSYLD